MSETSELTPAKSIASPGTLPPGDDEAVAKGGSFTTLESQPLHRQIFLDTHPGSPWTCYFCGGEVEELHVHHRDGDHANNDPDNLVATHGDCHAHHHRSGLESFERPPAASRLRIAAGSLDDIEGLRKSVANQKRGLAA